MEYPIVMRPGEENVSSFKYNLIHLQSIKLMCGGRSFFYFFFIFYFFKQFYLQDDHLHHLQY